MDIAEFISRYIYPPASTAILREGNFHISCMFNQFSCIPLQSTLITNMLAEIDVLFDVHEDFYERVREWEKTISDYLFVFCLFLTLFVQISFLCLFRVYFCFVSFWIFFCNRNPCKNFRQIRECRFIYFFVVTGCYKRAAFCFTDSQQIYNDWNRWQP